MSSSNAAKRALDDEQVEEENGHDAKRIKTEQPAETIADHVQEDGSDDDDKPVLPTGGTSASRKARTGAECPYLDSVSRQVREGCCLPWCGGHHHHNTPSTISPPHTES